MTTTGIILTIIGICSSIYYGQHNKQVSERNRVDSQYETIKVTLREQEAFIKTYYSTISENRTRLKQKFEENFCSKFLDSCKFHLNKCHHVLDLNGQFKNTEACELITKFDLATPLEYQLVPDAGDETFNSLMAPLVTLKHSIKRFKEVHLEFKKNREYRQEKLNNLLRHHSHLEKRTIKTSRHAQENQHAAAMIQSYAKICTEKYLICQHKLNKCKAEVSALLEYGKIEC